MYEGGLLVLHWPSSNDTTCTPVLLCMLEKHIRSHMPVHTEIRTHTEPGSEPLEWLPLIRLWARRASDFTCEYFIFERQSGLPTKLSAEEENIVL